MSIFTINRTYRNLQRLQTIVNVFLRHGFGELVERMGLTGVMSLGRRIVTFNRVEKIDRPQFSIAQRFRLAFEELGPCFVKFGQILSSRADIIPEEFIEELKLLQEHVPPFPFQQAKEVIEQQLKARISDVFEDFSEHPRAAASIAQVHFARLNSGRAVVVKVQRPGIDTLIQTDINILRNLAQLLERYIPESRQYNPRGLVEEFAISIQRELDFQLEATNTERFRQIFRDYPGVYVPEVFYDLTTRRVLTLERIEGIQIDRVDELRAAGLDPVHIAAVAGRAFLETLLTHGVFHADPHPGNVFVLPTGDVGIVDFGLTGRLDEEQMEALANLLIALITQDYARMIQELINLGYEIPEEVIRPLRGDLRDLIEPYYGRPLQQFDLAHTIARIVDIVSRYHVRIPPDFLLLTRALMIQEGIGRQLDPELDLVRLAAPMAADLLRRRYHPRRMAREAYSTLGEYRELIRHLPKQLSALIRKVLHGELQLDVVHRGLESVTRELDRLGNRITMSLVISALIVGSSLVMLSRTPPFLFGFPALGILGYTIAAIMALWLIVAIFKSGRL